MTFHKCGINAKPSHFEDLLQQKPAMALLEFHSENYFHTSYARSFLPHLRENYDFSFHGVGLSLGSSDGLSKTHLEQLKTLFDEFKPALVSDHLSFSGFGNIFTPDLLPFPLSNQALENFIRNVDTFQNFIGRKILIENPSLYIEVKGNEYSLSEFMNIICRETGCGILLDVNNLEVCRQNTDFNPYSAIDEIESGLVGEIHLAGYEIKNLSDGRTVFIDTHGHKTYPKVWDLYSAAIKKFGDVKTIVEWDTDVPPLSIMLEETNMANDIKQKALSHEHA